MDREFLTKRTFDEIVIGESASAVRIVRPDDIEMFAGVSGNANPAHLDAAFAAGDPFGHVVAHGMWTAALVSAVLGTKLPGPGTIYLAQDLRFLTPVTPGDTVTVRSRRASAANPSRRGEVVEMVGSRTLRGRQCGECNLGQPDGCSCGGFRNPDRRGSCHRRGCIGADAPNRIAA